VDDIVVHSLVPSDCVMYRSTNSLPAIPSTIRRSDTGGRSPCTGHIAQYLMDWQAGNGITVGLRQVPRSTVLGCLAGTGEYRLVPLPPLRSLSMRNFRSGRRRCGHGRWHDQ
jgi:hypothetical protein